MEHIGSHSRIVRGPVTLHTFPVERPAPATARPPCSEHLDYVADSAIPTLAITAAAAAATSNLSTARRLAARGHTAHHLAARRPTAHRPTEPWHEQRADRARRCVRDCTSVSERERALSVRSPRVAHGRVRLVVCASRSMERGLEVGAPAYACAPCGSLDRKSMERDRTSNDTGVAANVFYRPHISMKIT